MKFNTITIIAITFLLFTNLVCGQNKDEIPAERIFSVAELKEDFAVMKKTLKEFHSGLYRYNSPEQLEEKVPSLNRSGTSIGLICAMAKCSCRFGIQGKTAGTWAKMSSIGRSGV